MTSQTTPPVDPRREDAEPSTKRKVAATVTSAAVATALGIASTVIIDQVSQRVRHLIVPDQKS
jgi:hypothetical protein